MIGYICKYTPVEIFEAFGEEVKRLEPDVAGFNQADTLMHPNLCSFAKGIVRTAGRDRPDDLLRQYPQGL